jgi:hypothetical protein
MLLLLTLQVIRLGWQQMRIDLFILFICLKLKYKSGMEAHHVEDGFTYSIVNDAAPALRLPTSKGIFIFL